MFCQNSETMGQVFAKAMSKEKRTFSNQRGNEQYFLNINFSFSFIRKSRKHVKYAILCEFWPCSKFYGYYVVDLIMDTTLPLMIILQTVNNHSNNEKVSTLDKTDNLSINAEHEQPVNYKERITIIDHKEILI